MFSPFHTPLLPPASLQNPSAAKSRPSAASDAPAYSTINYAKLTDVITAIAIEIIIVADLPAAFGSRAESCPWGL